MNPEVLMKCLALIAGAIVSCYFSILGIRLLVKASRFINPKDPRSSQFLSYLVKKGYRVDYGLRLNAFETRRAGYYVSILGSLATVVLIGLAIHISKDLFYETPVVAFHHNSLPTTDLNTSVWQTPSDPSPNF
ncbi:MAG: hypothetical protein AAB594_00525 [Patescibacteria group bacterium]